jgi:hypothetical protein
MKKLATIAFLAALGVAATSTAAAAQFVYVAGGPTFPMSDYGDFANTGFQIAGGVGIPVGENGLSVFAEGSWGQNNHSDVDGDKTNPITVMGGLQYEFDTGGNLTPYVFGMGGILWHKYASDTFTGSTDSGFGYGGGVGAAFPLGSLTGAVEGRITNASINDFNTMYTSILAGIGIPLGS